MDFIFKLLPFCLFAWLVFMLVGLQAYSLNEIGRFSKEKDSENFIQKWIYKFLATLGARAALTDREKADLEVEKEITLRLREAGLESAIERGSFVLLKIISYLLGPVVGGISYLYLIPYYATVLTIILTISGLLFPVFWLKSKKRNRNEDIQRELPLLIDLTNLGASAGWDISVALERAIDNLSEKFPGHPLMREFKRARLLATTGYTWDESLARVGKALENDAVRRCTLALSQALRQGGDRTTQLDGIAEDAQRIYYAELDKRLAGMPVKAVLVTMVLMIAYLLIVLAPAGVQVRQTFIGMKTESKVQDVAANKQNKSENPI
ncbi:MAG: type II secretion system F family protein [bacterium]|nr:type II secretion system F family protein [bacterium]